MEQNLFSTDNVIKALRYVGIALTILSLIAVIAGFISFVMNYSIASPYADSSENSFAMLSGVSGLSNAIWMFAYGIASIGFSTVVKAAAIYIRNHEINEPDEDEPAEDPLEAYERTLK